MASSRGTVMNGGPITMAMAFWKIFSMLTLALATLSAGPSLAQERRAEYRLAAGDSVRIQVFQNPDLNLETRVSENHEITYPLIGTARIGGLTLADAEQTLAKALRDGGFIKQPQVIIVLLQNRGNQVSVLGQVNKPGRFPLDTVTVRLSEMIATAGGIAPTGADVVTVSGVRNGKTFHHEVDLGAMLLSGSREKDIVLRAGDDIYVERNPVFYIYGEIQRPGLYRVDRNMTVRQAIAISGGLAPRGTDRGLRLFRRGSDGTETILPAPALSDPVRADDVLYVPQGFF